MKRRRLRDGRELAVRDNDGLRKVCGCPRRAWPKCPHPWHFNFKWAGTPYRFSLDRELGLRVATKGEARKEADKLRTAIREGTFRQQRAIAPTPAAAPGDLTLLAFGELFVRQCPIRSGKRKGQPRYRLSKSGALQGNDASMVRQLGNLPGADAQPIGPRTIASITEADLEAVLRSLGERRRSASTRNKFLQLFQSLTAWGRRKGYPTRSWMNDEREDSDLHRARGTERHRRLEPGEEARLLAHATPRLQRLILAALETCMREGELLHLQWRDVGPRFLKVRETKTGDPRDVPISAALRAVLEMARTSPTGHPFPADAYVFGDGVGGFMGSPDTAWENAVLRTHGVKPARSRTGALKPDARAAYQRIDLTFHDLRHEAGSRYLERGMPLHEVSAMLGHRNIATTSRYLNARAHGILASMERIDAARTPALQAVASGAASEHPPTLQPEARDVVPARVN